MEDPKTDHIRWRLKSDNGRQTWHYLDSDKERETWPMSAADKYFMGMDTVSTGSIDFTLAKKGSS